MSAIHDCYSRSAAASLRRCGAGLGWLTVLFVGVRCADRDDHGATRNADRRAGTMQNGSEVDPGGDLQILPFS